MYDIIIIGGGPAGLTAAVYARRAGKSTLIIERDTFGGQIAQSPRVENYPGCISISGLELADRLLSHAMENGAEVELDEAVSLREEGGIVTVSCASGAEFPCRAVIIANGAKPRQLGLAHEEELTGCGVSYCAVCDGAFFKDHITAVVGGGSSALQDAILLCETCKEVYLIHRRDSFRGEPALVEAAKKRANISFVMNARITELLGEDELTGVVIEQNGETKVLPVDGLFIAAGRSPELLPFSDFMNLDESGYADSGESCLTPTPWLFTAGDCRAKEVRQVATAISDGAVAALAAVKFLDSAV